MMTIIGIIYTVFVIGILELFATGRIVIPEKYIMFAMIWVFICLFAVMIFHRKQR